jgi:ATP-binding cassette subfamily A (ABC1) protein 3
MTVISIVGAVLPVVLFEQTQGICTILSIIFPFANFTYYVTGHAVFESMDKQVSMTGSAYTVENRPPRSDFRMPLYFHWVIVIVHLFVFPLLAFVTETLLHSIASKNRTFVKPEAANAPTVVLAGFTKT